MTLRQEHDALASGIAETKEGELYSGGHSWGYAYVDKNGELQIHKEVGTIPETVDIPVTDNALVHTRLTTRGKINYTNAHPMRIADNNDNVVAAMAHNGTWQQSPQHDWFSDTWHMARIMELNYIQTGDFEKAFIETADQCSETIVALTANGVGYVYAGRFSIYQEDSIFQSTNCDKLVRSGHVKRIDTDGNVELVDTNVGNPYSRFRRIKIRK